MGQIAATIESEPKSPPGPFERFVGDSRGCIRDFYDALGDRQLTWNRRFGYYRRHLRRLVGHFVPRGARVLDIGCGTGDVLHALQPGDGVGVDCSPAMVELARRQHPRLKFLVGFAESLDETDLPDGPYEYITLINVIGDMCDIGTALRGLHRYCSAETRVVITHYNHLWEPICRLAGRMGLKPNTPTPNWLSPNVLSGLLHLNGFEVVRLGWALPLPVRVPGLNWLCNSVMGRINGLRRLGFLSYVVARPVVPAESPQKRTCSVVVPCKDEQDNIDGLVNRIPEMGAGTEIIFVDDRSTDRTAARTVTSGWSPGPAKEKVLPVEPASPWPPATCS